MIATRSVLGLGVLLGCLTIFPSASVSKGLTEEDRGRFFELTGECAYSAFVGTKLSTRLVRSIEDFDRNAKKSNWASIPDHIEDPLLADVALQEKFSLSAKTECEAARELIMTARNLGADVSSELDYLNSLSSNVENAERGSVAVRSKLSELVSTVETNPKAKLWRKCRVGLERLEAEKAPQLTESEYALEQVIRRVESLQEDTNELYSECSELFELSGRFLELQMTQFGWKNEATSRKFGVKERQQRKLLERARALIDAGEIFEVGVPRYYFRTVLAKEAQVRTGPMGVCNTHLPMGIHDPDYKTVREGCLTVVDDPERYTHLEIALARINLDDWDSEVHDFEMSERAERARLASERLGAAIAERGWNFDEPPTVSTFQKAEGPKTDELGRPTKAGLEDALNNSLGYVNAVVNLMASQCDLDESVQNPFSGMACIIATDFSLGGEGSNFYTRVLSIGQCRTLKLTEYLCDFNGVTQSTDDNPFAIGIAYIMNTNGNRIAHVTRTGDRWRLGRIYNRCKKIDGGWECEYTGYRED